MVQRVVVALGGNAMTGPSGEATQEAQQAAVECAAQHIGDLLEAGHQVVVTHGNGPQVGNLLVKNELAAHVVPPVSLDWCVAQTQATIGLLVQNALDRVLAERGLPPLVATLVTRCLVDADDPGFDHPTKPVGRFVSEVDARRFMALGQRWESRGGRGWRRVVASPEPREVLDAPAVEALLDAGYVVVAGGGGGIPVVRRDGVLAGVEAVLDKDRTAALLASTVGAEVLVIATDVDHVALDFATPAQRMLERVTATELRSYAAAGHFASGSMGPKVQAAIRFVEHGGRLAAISSLDRIDEAAQGKAGTVVEPDS